MANLLRFLSFLFIFMGIYAAMHWYVLARLAFFFSIPRNTAFYLVFAVSSLSYLSTHIVDARYPSIISRFLCGAAAVWMGVLFLLFFTLLSGEAAKIIFRMKPVTTGLVVCIVAVSLAVYAAVNALSVRVRQVTVRSDKVAEPVTIVHLSDLHLGSIHRPDYIKEVVALTNGCSPDLVCITGDLVDRIHPHTPELLTAFSEIKVPVLYVTGNHDRYAGMDAIIALLEKTNITVLRNKAADIGPLHILGIDDDEGKRQVAEVLPGFARYPERFTVLLYHRPDGLDAAEKAGIDLFLTGHVHAGQVFPFNLFVRMFYQFVSGIHTVGTMTINVSPGTGTWGPPMRLGSKNEITRIQIQPR